MHLNADAHGQGLLLVGGVNISRPRSDLMPDEPIPDYIRIREELCADVIDPRTVETSPRPLVRLAARLVGVQWAAAIAALLSHKRYAAVIATGEDVGLRLAILARIAFVSLPIIMVCHNLDGRLARLSLGVLRIGREIRIFHCLNRTLARLLIDRYGIPEHKVRVVHWHVDHDFFRPAPARASEPPLICSAGSASRDYETLIEASDGLNVALKIAADSPWWRQRVNLSQRHIHPWVDIASLGTYGRLRSLYASARFVVVPLVDTNRAAGISVILEGMAMGKAVIATRTRCSDDLIIDGRNGFHVPPNDVAQLRDRMQFLLDHADEAERMGGEGRRMIEQHFTIDRYISELRDTLSAIGSGSKRYASA